ncbi:MAG TPA: hypothetical protein VHN82_04635 [Methanoregula sp.]|nr:hypothetical protein [Methanoregula sp.]
MAAYLFDLPGFGGAVACTVINTLIICYGLTVRWISKGHKKKSQ